AEVHGAEAEPADAEAGAAEADVGHVRALSTAVVSEQQAPYGAGLAMLPKLTDRAYCLAAVVLAAAVFGSITANYFHADDFNHLQSIANYPTLRWICQPKAGHLYMVRNALFSLSYAVFGAEPAAFFWSVLLTHLVNVGLLFAVINQLTQSKRLAFVGATAWGISPVNEGTLGWYSVYGQVIAATFVLVVLLRLARRFADG